MSLQLHKFRSEHWIVVEGTAKITKGKSRQTLHKNESTFFFATHFHQIVKYEELKSLAELIFADTEELLEGLTSSDTGERRSAALDSFNDNINLFQDKIDEIVAINTSG